MRAGRRGTGMNDKKTKEVDGRESVSMLPGVTVGVMIAVIAFVLSFDALRLVFVSSGINPLLSWGGPLCVDGTILLCTWATWGFRKGHIRGRWYPWAGLVLFSLFSVTGNALHAWLNAGGMLPTWGAPAIMSIPPIALLYSTHLIVIIAGDRQDKLARTTGKAAGPDNGHAGPAATTPETAGTEPVRTENPPDHPHADGRTGAGQSHGTRARRPAGPLPVRPAGPSGNRRESGKEGGSGGHPVRPGPHMALRDVHDHDIRKAHGVHNPHGPHGPGPCGPGPCGPGPHGPETRDGSQGPAGPGGRGSCGPRRT